jgi:hypothetical protein
VIVVRNESDGSPKRHNPERLLVHDRAKVKARFGLIVRVHIVNLRLAIHFDGARVKVLVVPLVQETSACERTFVFVAAKDRMNLTEPIERVNSVVEK